MERLNEIIREAWKAHLNCAEPWYRRKSLWLMATALVVPFGWLLPVCRVAWVRVNQRTMRRF